MAKIEPTPIIDGISGKVGSLVFRRQQDGTTTFSEQPDRFRQAAAYAREASRSVPLYTELAGQTQKSAYAIALADRLNSPEIHRISRRLGYIDIYTTDDVCVTKIYVTISNEQGIILEQGQATQVQDEWWEYSTDVPGSVLVQVFDLAGNITRQQA